MRYLLFLLIGVLIVGCSTTQHNQPEYTIEQDVFNNPLKPLNIDEVATKVKPASMTELASLETKTMNITQNTSYKLANFQQPNLCDSFSGATLVPVIEHITRQGGAKNWLPILTYLMSSYRHRMEVYQVTDPGKFSQAYGFAMIKGPDAIYLYVRDPLKNKSMAVSIYPIANPIKIEKTLTYSEDPYVK